MGMKAQDERPNRPGKAAPEVRRYLDELERIHLRAAKRAQGTEGLLSDYPVDALAAILDRAAARVADDADALLAKINAAVPGFSGLR